MSGRYTTSSCRIKTTSALLQEKVTLQSQQGEAGHVHGCASLVAELAVLVQTAGRLPAGHCNEEETAAMRATNWKGTFAERGWMSWIIRWHQGTCTVYDAGTTNRRM